MYDRTPFAVLGIAPDAEPEVVAAAYRALARKYHPDVNRGAASNRASVRMRELNWAKDELERDILTWRTRARQAERRRGSPKKGARSSSSAKAIVPQEFDVEFTLAEWLAGEGERTLDRLLHEGGTGNFAIAAVGSFYVQFKAAKGDTTVYVEAVSNAYLPRPKRLTAKQIAALQELRFHTDDSHGNFVLDALPSAPAAAQIAGTVLGDVYGQPSSCDLNVHICFDDAVVVRL